MAKYEKLRTRQQIVAEIKKRFEGVEKLSKRNVGKTTACLYAHEANGVGCAIGCLFTPEDAEKLDGQFSAIGNILDPATEDPRRKIVAQRIDLRVRREWLTSVQMAHDGSFTVWEFLKKLDKLAPAGSQTSVLQIAEPA